ncbi:MAG: hypothetical protein ACI4U3_02210 [Traorella sp.]
MEDNVLEQLEAIKEMYSSKGFLASLLKEHVEEFETLSLSEIKECFIEGPLINQKTIFMSKQNCGQECTHDIFFKVKSPNIKKNHEVICSIQFGFKKAEEDKNEIPVIVNAALSLYAEAIDNNKERGKIFRCYSFYFLLDEDEEKRGKEVRYNLHMSIQKPGKDLLGDNCCVGIEIYL